MHPQLNPGAVFVIALTFYFMLCLARDWLAAKKGGQKLFQLNTAAPVSPTIKGKTTIVWGTAPGGTAVTPVISGLIVTSISITPNNGGPVTKIENGDGSVIAKVYLDDGFEADVEAIYDSTLTYPAMYSAVTLTLPKAVDMSGGTAVAAYPCTIESNAVKFERKKEAMITFKISHNPGVEGAGS